MSDSLRPHESQHARPPCPSPTLKFTQTHVHWISDAIQPISSSAVHFSSCSQSLPASGSFPVVMYVCESWTLKKAEHWRIDAFELWCWRRLLRVPWAARRSNQSILKEISPRCSLEGLMLKLKLQCFDHLMRRVDSLEKTLMLGGIGSRRRSGQQRMRLAGWHHWFSGHEYG